MRSSRPGPLLILSLVILAIISSCGLQDKGKYKIVYVNSYHQGHPPSDQITAGLLESLPADSFEVIAHFMDTKRNPTQEYIEAKAEALLDSIQKADPDLLVVSDDNAVKYLVQPHLQDQELPVVFCGVNWSADPYGLSRNNITGILELLPVEEVMTTMKTYYPSMQSLLVLNENTTTSRKTKPILDTLLNPLNMEVTQALVDDFESWKAAFEEGNRSHDIIYLQTQGAIRGWDHEEAIQFIDQHIKVPVITCEDHMMPYAVFGMTQVSREQGTWAAEAAKKILRGIPSSEIPVSKNQLVSIWFNPNLAEKVGFQLDPSLKGKARIISN
jgi:ABC-type uncharacterized transport system substrate-binding protein